MSITKSSAARMTESQTLKRNNIASARDQTRLLLLRGLRNGLGDRLPTGQNEKHAALPSKNTSVQLETRTIVS